MFPSASLSFQLKFVERPDERIVDPASGSSPTSPIPSPVTKLNRCHLTIYGAAHHWISRSRGACFDSSWSRGRGSAFYSSISILLVSSSLANANATRPQRRPTVCWSMQHLFSFVDIPSLFRLCCNDGMSHGLSMQPPPPPTLNKQSIASIRGSNMLLDFQIA
ncbi:uncharacterized protein TrAtP1_010310 [Trichoderma atroviride]|uniref:uncharacterized protein n=1 Tax=Hypocrea atroviridis TaxID=63577 RepID=UPI00331B413C|nr:hypothetical protein TrAtP1_010310 [Trichoderma atroviride]